MGRNLCTFFFAVLLVLCVFVAEGPAEDEVYQFSLAWAPWSISMARQAVEDQPKDPYWQYLAKTLGVVPLTLSWEWDGGRTYMSQLRLYLASGDVPEALKAWDLDFTREIIDMGITIPLDDLLKEHGQNIWNAFSEEDWDIMRSLSPDGKIHAIPNYMGIHRARTGFIRKDWLDRVGMDIPKTRDELLAVYKAFKENDANGNGDPDDEIGVSGRAGMRWCDDLFNMHGVVMYEGFPQWRWDPAKQQMVSEQVSPEMKNAIEFLRLLVKEGYMDKTMPLQTRPDWSAKINSNRVGHYFHLVDEIAEFSGFMNEEPNAEWVAFTLPAVPGVKPQNTYLSRTYTTELCITKEARDPVKIIKWFDWLNSQEGSMYKELGIPGVNFTLEDGKVKILKPRTQYYIWDISGVPMVEEVIKISVLGDVKMQSIETIKDRVSWTWDNIGMPLSVYKGYADYLPKQAKLYREYCSKMVLGELPMSAWDEYVEKWYAAGGEVVTQRATEWYKEVKLK